MTVTYRDAVAADAAPLDAMALASWIETFAHASAAADWQAYVAQAYGPAGQLIRDLTSGAAHFRLALTGDRIAGYAKLGPPWLPAAEPGALQLAQLYVASDWHGRGIAPVLMDWSIAQARAAAAPALLLTVWEENHRAKRFYERVGFQHIGDYAFPVGQQIDTDHIMRLAL